jgi:toxin YoeB
VRNLIFRGKTWEKYEEIRESEKQLHKNLVKLIRELLRGDPAQGSGKPESLRHQLAGLWSRRISQKDRLIYRFDDKNIEIIAIGGHYDD